jgi:GTP-binding protein
VIRSPLLRVVSSRFERAAARPADEPRAAGPDVVFMGRSNVGKSSLINGLLGASRLARTSAVPGRTRTINFYRVNESCYFVDLPGYGYAKVSAAVRRSWRPMVEGYLERRRRRIALALLVVDAQVEATDLDLTMRDWLASRRIPFVVAATKADRLSASGRARAARRLALSFGADPALGPLLVSPRTGLGLRRLWASLDAALRARAPCARPAGP